jgi:8-oxo-dGTP pyrophosphatase MutT (NUDIX family)
MAGETLIRVKHMFGPRLTLGVRLLALDDAGRVFLVRHSYLPGLHLPGGAVDPGESCAGAAEREAAEEGGLLLAEPPLLFQVYMNPSGGRHDHVVLYVARGVRQAGPKAPSLEIVAAGFHSIAPPPEDATRATRDRISEVIGGRAPSERW